ncbi:hypothetical protein KGM_214535 [Danaus plexippus plexippus]|uniref:Uncharacterized protein n=1 Tax=Danaus plexippus plexippus TaxID=278856 RepID=A0A212EI27_DANPL|nr:hypothetical protein KGM_214535 [Danaus plexippus plexippus]
MRSMRRKEALSKAYLVIYTTVVDNHPNKAAQAHYNNFPRDNGQSSTSIQLTLELFPR